MKYSAFLAFAALLALPACEAAKERMAETMDSISEMSIPSISKDIGQSTTSDRLLAKGACPVVDIVSDLSVFHDFANTAQPDPSTLASRAILGKYESSCSYGPKSVSIDLGLFVNATLGPQGRLKTSAPAIAYPFFVAVVAPGGGIATKEVFAAPLNFPPGANQQSHRAKLRQIIPLANVDNGKHYKILAGFQLSKSQLDYNRALIELAKKQAASSALQQRKITLQPQKQVPLTPAPGQTIPAPGAVTQAPIPLQKR